MNIFYYQNQQLTQAATWKELPNEVLAIVPKTTLKPGQHLLHIVYRGEIGKSYLYSQTMFFDAMVFFRSQSFKRFKGDDLRGFYRTKTGRKLANEKDEYALVSQFEPVACRKCFPCFDQPNMKATFTVKMVIPKNLRALRSGSHLIEKFLIIDDSVFFFFLTLQQYEC